MMAAPMVPLGCPKRIGNNSDKFDNWFYLNGSVSEGYYRLRKIKEEYHV